MEDLSECMAAVTITKKKIAASFAKRKTNTMSGVACFEPCQFPRCLNTCMHECNDGHGQHYCSDHACKPKLFVQQPIVKKVIR